MRALFQHSVRLPSWLLVLGGLTTLVPLEALARGGGGEHYTRDSPSYGNGDGDAGLIYLFFRLITFAFRYPKVGIPLLILAVVIYYFYKRNLHPTGATQRAFERREAEQRTQVSDQSVLGWVQSLKRKDPQFEAQGVLDKVRQLFPALQEAWFQRELTPVRPFLSDATYQRFNVQLQLMAAQGVRDAISDIRLLDARIIGLEQSEWFDSLQVRVQAQMRDTDVPASASDAQALEAARRAPLESFTEVWTFVRKPGAVTRIGQDVYQGKCPQCGAPYKGGASNVCEYCQAIVNSGNYDWTLSEITQGIEHNRHAAPVDGLGEARRADPALNLEVLEDRASLLFWKWIDAQSQGDEKRLAQVANTELVSQLGTELSTMRQQGQRRVILECAVGAVVTRTLEVHPEGDDRAHVEIRWSARLGMAAANERPRELPTVPQRWVFTLTRRHGVKTNTSNGMATDRCPECNAPLTSSGASACAYCGTQLGTSARDWVLATTLPYETWEAQTRYRRVPGAQAPVASPARATDTVVDVQERERLLYMMASIAAADGTVDATERKLLKVCATRWSIPWQNVEMALNAGQPLFQKLMPTKGSPEASVFMDHLVQMALVDGRVDMKERRMLVSTAMHLGVLPQLESMLRK
ncbi:zinc-ribbon domain-containing protein [Stigmatella aurantiaca]|uniref:Zinc-ribbon domain-containing protein n=1 Tax=Stigmatella aurantiaca TaxID=41 RepID=A0A1H7JVS0_STIAU|nr:TIM44-like domain-containing protein [Stigmatella aurantiaca]SEK78821.1 zinc-ribbon domain-containing protein [Stigmatella aurantiaca]